MPFPNKQPVLLAPLFLETVSVSGSMTISGLSFRTRILQLSFLIEGSLGRPPFRLALTTILQFIEGLSDRGAADAVRGRIDWKYLLCLELDDPGFDYSVLCEFRARLLEGGAERILFDKILSELRGKKLVKSR